MNSIFNITHFLSQLKQQLYTQTPDAEGVVKSVERFSF